MNVKKCKWCGGTNHSSLMCFSKPRQRIRNTSIKTEQLEIEAKLQWFEANPSDENGNWICYLKIHPLCPVVLTRDTITQEHVKPKQRYPELKYVISNRRPSCKFCNRLKSGQSIETLAKTYPHLQKLLVDTANVSDYNTGVI